MSESRSSKSSRHRAHPRHRHRARQHESAHAAAEQHPEVKYPEHPLIPRSSADWIDTPDGLAELLDHLRSVGSFAYDSEFIGEMSYVPKLCLLQVATTSRIALVDPLLDLDLSPFWDLVADPSIEKIVHAGQQDLEPVFRLVNKSPANIFDTQIASGFAALAYPSALSKLVRQLLGIRIGKGFTFTHWDDRPLSPVQMRYAADDVRFLPAMRAELATRLAGLGHASWASEESENLCDAELYNFDPHKDFYRIRGAGSLEPKGLGVLRALVVWREAAARQADLPPRSFLRDDILIDLARRPVRSLPDLDRVKGLPRPVELQHGQEILDATLGALALPSAELPHPPKAVEESPAEKFRIDSLWSAAQGLCMGLGIDPAVAATRGDVSRLYKGLAHHEDLSSLRLMRGWRGAALGEPLLALLKGEANLQVRWHDNRLAVQKL